MATSSSSEPAGEPPDNEPAREPAKSEADPGNRLGAEELSAGGVVVRGDEVLVIVPRKRAADGRKVLALPKGHLDPGERAEQAAAREVREEGGVDADIVGYLGDVRYWYRRGGRSVPKRVVFFQFDYRGGDPADHDDEVEEARFITFEQARETLTYDGEREMVMRALSRLSADR